MLILFEEEKEEKSLLILWEEEEKSLLILWEEEEEKSGDPMGGGRGGKVCVNPVGGGRTKD